MALSDSAYWYASLRNGTHLVSTDCTISLTVIRLSNHTYQHHQFMLIYATECGIGHTSYEYIFSNLRSTTARSNMTQECVNLDEHCDGDHCFHHLMLISNSIYFCFPMDQTTNRCLSVSRKKARDWNYTLAQREYVCGN